MTNFVYRFEYVDQPYVINDDVTVTLLGADIPVVELHAYNHHNEGDYPLAHFTSTLLIFLPSMRQIRKRLRGYLKLGLES